MKGISFFFFLLLLFCGNDIHVVTAGPAAYASCQAMAALGCGPAGYAACQAASAAGCLSTGFGWPACYAGCQAVCAGLGGATFAACYGSAQAACAATFLAPTPWGWEQTLQVVQMVMRCAGLPFCCHTWSSISSLTATRLLYLRIYIYINIFNVIAQPHWLALPYQQLEVILYPSFSILSLSFYKSSIVTHLHGYFPQLHLHYCTNFRLSISNHSIYSVKTPKNILISIYESFNVYYTHELPSSSNYSMMRVHPSDGVIDLIRKLNNLKYQVPSTSPISSESCRIDGWSFSDLRCKRIGR